MPAAWKDAINEHVEAATGRRRGPLQWVWCVTALEVLGMDAEELRTRLSVVMAMATRDVGAFERDPKLALAAYRTALEPYLLAREAEKQAPRPKPKRRSSQP